MPNDISRTPSENDIRDLSRRLEKLRAVANDLDLSQLRSLANAWDTIAAMLPAYRRFIDFLEIIADLKSDQE